MYAASRGVLEMIEILKVKREFLYLLLTLTQEKNVKVSRFPLIHLDETILAHTNLAEFNKFLQEKENEALLKEFMDAPEDARAVFLTGSGTASMDAVTQNVFTKDARLLVVALGTIGYAAVGTLFAALSINTRAREVMLPILLFPVMVPVFVAGVQAVSRLLDGETLSDIIRWVQLLVAYDAIFLAAAMLLFDYVVEE